MKKKFMFMDLLKGLCLAIIITFVMIFVIAMMLRFTGLRETRLPMLNNIVLVFSIVISSIYLVGKVKENGWLYGALLGLLYYSIIVLVNVFFSKVKFFQPISIIKLVIAMIIGAIGGIIGINII